MTHPAQHHAARRALTRHGRDVTHVTFTQSGTDAYGDPEWSRSATTVTARLQNNRAPWQLRAPDEVDALQKATIYVDDSVTVTDETASGRPDEFDIDYDGDGSVDDTYKVAKAEHQDNGLIVCECRLVE